MIGVFISTKKPFAVCVSPRVLKHAQQLLRTPECAMIPHEPAQVRALLPQTATPDRQKLFQWCIYAAFWEERIQCAAPAHRDTGWDKQLEPESVALTQSRAEANEKPSAWQV